MRSFSGVENMKERDLQKWIIQYAEIHGWYVYHVANVRGQLRSNTAIGYPDLTMARGDRLVFAELKAKRGRVTEPQLRWLNRLQDLKSVECYLWKPTDMETIRELLE